MAFVAVDTVGSKESYCQDHQEGPRNLPIYQLPLRARSVLCDLVLHFSIRDFETDVGGFDAIAVPEELRKEVSDLSLRVVRPQISSEVLSTLWATELESNLSIHNTQLNNSTVDVLCSVGRFDAALKVCEKYRMKMAKCMILIRQERYQELFQIIDDKMALSEINTLVR
jgi:hypothetical protein